MLVIHSSSFARLISITAGMSFALVCCVPSLAQSSGQTEPPADVEVTLDLLEPIHLAAAKEYVIFAVENRAEKLTLRETPITQWVNQRRAGGQLGHVFVWMNGERPAAIAGIFSFPWRGVVTDRRVVHEFHALAPARLEVTRKGRRSRWQPKAGTSECFR